MLGISFGEIMIIGTIGLIVIGPKRLPETARFLGHLFGRVQRQVSSVKADIRREMALEDMKNIHRDYEESARDMRNAFDQAASGIPPAETLLSSTPPQGAAAAQAADAGDSTTATAENDADSAADSDKTPAATDSGDSKTP